MSAAAARKSKAELDYIAKEIRSRLEFAKKHREKADAMETSAGKMLAEARENDFDTYNLWVCWVENKIGMSESWANELCERHLKPEQLTAKQRADKAATEERKEAVEAYRRAAEREAERAYNEAYVPPRPRSSPQPTSRETPSSRPQNVTDIRTQTVKKLSAEQWSDVRAYIKSKYGI